MKGFLPLVAAVALSGCATANIGAIYGSHMAEPVKPRDVFLTIDGTGNTQISRTNAARLFEMVDAQGLDDGRELATFYAEGVGSNGNFLGLGVGLGMSQDIKQAYEFLTTAYDPKGRLLLNGFSRGAYAVRALGGMIAIAGIPDLRETAPAKRKRIVDSLFDAYKTSRRNGETDEEHDTRRLDAMRNVAGRMNFDLRGEGGATRIFAMTLWDTVAALGRPDGTELAYEELSHYNLTSCNADNVFHALSLDDNRAYSFTPIFVEGKAGTQRCSAKNGNVPDVEEVWFAGAHADVGGAYSPGEVIEGHLSGVSLNWMITGLQSISVLTKQPEVYADSLGPIHDAKSHSFAYRPLYRNFRDPLNYHEQAIGTGKPKVHVTAIERLAVAGELDKNFASCPREQRSGGSVLLCGYDLSLFGFVPEMVPDCLNRVPLTGEPLVGYRLREGQTCVEIVCDGRGPEGFCAPEFNPVWLRRRANEVE